MGMERSRRAVVASLLAGTAMLVAPAAVAAETVTVLNKSIHEVVAIPEVKQRYAELGIEAEASAPEQLKARLEADIKKWAAVIERANIPKQ